MIFQFWPESKQHYMPWVDNKEASSPMQDVKCKSLFPLQQTYLYLVIKFDEMHKLISKNYMQGLLAGLSAQT